MEEEIAEGEVVENSACQYRSPGRWSSTRQERKVVNVDIVEGDIVEERVAE